MEFFHVIDLQVKKVPRWNTAAVIVRLNNIYTYIYAASKISKIWQLENFGYNLKVYTALRFYLRLHIKFIVRGILAERAFFYWLKSPKL